VTGFAQLLLKSANQLEIAAEEIKIVHFVRGRWLDADPTAKTDYDDLRNTAKELRKAQKYHLPNPLGGPAKLFDAIADRIRAGEDQKSVMDDYGVRFK
jgi:hypothetical protein